VIGVQAERAAAFPASLAAGHPVQLHDMNSIADGVSVGIPGKLTFSVIRQSKWVDQVLTVTEESICQAILFLMTRNKVVCEPAGSVACAALIQHPHVFSSSAGPVVVTLSGGNIEPFLLMRIMQHGMKSYGRYVTFQVRTVDKPGNLASILSVIAAHGANVTKCTRVTVFLFSDVRLASPFRYSMLATIASTPRFPSTRPTCSLSLKRAVSAVTCIVLKHSRFFVLIFWVAFAGLEHSEKLLDALRQQQCAHLLQTLWTAMICNAMRQVRFGEGSELHCVHPDTIFMITEQLCPRCMPSDAQLYHQYQHLLLCIQRCQVLCKLCPSMPIRVQGVLQLLARSGGKLLQKSRNPTGIRH
jgi:hypothetical protein